MQVFLNVDKTHLAFLTVSILIVTGIAFAAAAVPDPGHSLTDIEGYNGDNNLQESLGKFCQTDGTNCPIGASPEWILVNSNNAAPCPPGYTKQGGVVLMGTAAYYREVLTWAGGCWKNSHPIHTNEYYCMSFIYCKKS